MTDSETPIASLSLPLSAARSSLVITIANGLGVTGGIILDAVTAARFGLGREMDTFFLAATLPQLIVSVFNSVGARALVPVFTQILSQGGKGDFERFLSVVVTLGLLAMGGVVAVSVILSPWIVRALAPGLSPESLSLAVHISRILWLGVLPLVVIEPLRAMHLTYGRFFLVSVTNTLRFGVIIASVCLLWRPWGIMALAWGYTLGMLAQALYLALTFYWYGGQYVPALQPHHPALRILLNQFIPPLIGELTGQSNVIAERFFSSFLAPGIVSALGYARRIVTALHGLFVTNVGLALLPHLSLETFKCGKEQVRQLIALGIRLTTLLTSFVTVSVMTLSPPLTGLLFRRGAFDQSAAKITAQMVTIFVPSISFMSVSYLLVTALYTYYEARLVMRLRLVLLTTTVLFDLIMLHVWDGMGLAAAYTLAQLVYLIIAYLVLSRRLGYFTREFKHYLMRLGVAMLGAGTVMAATNCIRWFHLSSPLSDLLQLAFASAAGAVIYVLLVIYLRVLSWQNIRQLVAGRTGKTL